MSVSRKSIICLCLLMLVLVASGLEGVLGAAALKKETLKGSKNQVAMQEDSATVEGGESTVDTESAYKKQKLRIREYTAKVNLMCASVGERMDGDARNTNPRCADSIDALKTEVCDFQNVNKSYTLRCLRLEKISQSLRR
eukprot:Nk52_evm31s208 gene=Nk52_evmTU31s208